MCRWITASPRAGVAVLDACAGVQAMSRPAVVACMGRAHACGCCKLCVTPHAEVVALHMPAQESGNAEDNLPLSSRKRAREATTVAA